MFEHTLNSQLLDAQGRDLISFQINFETLHLIKLDTFCIGAMSSFFLIGTKFIIYINIDI